MVKGIVVLMILLLMSAASFAKEVTINVEPPDANLSAHIIEFTSRGYKEEPLATFNQYPATLVIPQPGVLMRIGREGYLSRSIYIYPHYLEDDSIYIPLRPEALSDGTFQDVLEAESLADSYLANMDFSRSLSQYRRAQAILEQLILKDLNGGWESDSLVQYYTALARIYTKLSNEHFLYMELEPQTGRLGQLERDVNRQQELLQEAFEAIQLLERLRQDPLTGIDTGLPAGVGMPAGPGMGVPGIPGAPITPGVPGAPITPGVPGAPITPGVPGAPITPGVPTTPGMPGGVPGAPATAETVIDLWEEVQELFSQTERNRIASLRDDAEALFETPEELSAEEASALEGRIEGIRASIESVIDGRLQRQEERIANIENRIRAIENSIDDILDTGIFDSNRRLAMIEAALRSDPLNRDVIMNSVLVSMSTGIENPAALRRANNYLTILENRQDALQTLLEDKEERLSGRVQIADRSAEKRRLEQNLEKQIEVQGWVVKALERIEAGTIGTTSEQIAMLSDLGQRKEDAFFYIFAGITASITPENSPVLQEIIGTGEPMEIFKKAVAMGPSNFYYPDACYYLGLEYAKQYELNSDPGDREKAIGYISTAIKQKPLLYYAQRAIESARFYYPVFSPSLLQRSADVEYPWIELALIDDLGGNIIPEIDSHYMAGLSFLQPDYSDILGTVSRMEQLKPYVADNIPEAYWYYEDLFSRVFVSGEAPLADVDVAPGVPGAMPGTGVPGIPGAMPGTGVPGIPGAMPGTGVPGIPGPAGPGVPGFRSP